MKPIKNILITGTVLVSLFLTGCSEILEENPRSTFTPEFFKTESGVMSGVTSLYARLRYIYGNGYYLNMCETGTDEVTWAQSADQNFKDMDLSGSGTLTSTSSRSDVVWANAFQPINTASGIIQYGTEAGISASVLAEARFFRAFNYFLLVQTFGGVPMDLGSGELKFNTSTYRGSVRNTVPEVYTKAVFPDLLQAITDLPNAGRVTGGVTKTVARLYLAKSYLTYGWWLQNPNNIPTYPTCERVDPDGHNAAWYFQQAYDVAKAAIESPATYGLLPYYYDVNLGSNDRNKEILLYADHTQSSEYYNSSSLSYSNGAAPENFAIWMMTWNYTNIRSSSSSASWSGVSSVQRAATQPLGRPWTRMCPTIGAIKNTFADKTNDSRYDGTFVTTYRGNWVEAGLKVNNAVPTTLYNANLLPVSNGGAILSFIDDDTPGITYAATNANIGAGVLPGRADFVIGPSAISRLRHPGLWKLGVYRTDNASGLGQPNGASTRPFSIAKFSELFLVAAEAAVKGATTSAMTGTYANDGSAKGLVNVLRARAGKWYWSNSGNTAKVQDNSAAMISATPATINIDYILAERSREFYGEGYRWYDLIRTQKWTDIATKFSICGIATGDFTPVEYTRTIANTNYLRPIPQSQIDAMEMTAEEKAAYQNPGY